MDISSSGNVDPRGIPGPLPGGGDVILRERLKALGYLS
jgi:hypothetical protein